jgi:hypothetical protein
MRRPRARRWRLAALSCWLVACSACAGCSGCGDAHVAELLEVHGRAVERDFHGEVGRWQPTQVGARFGLGDGVRARAKAHAIVQLDDGSLVRLQPGTVLRFMTAVENDDEQGLDVQVGEAEVSVGALDMPLRTQLGLAVIERGSRVVLRRAGDERMVYRVELGAAKLQRERGGYELVRGGELVEVEIGMSVVERRRTDAPAQAAAEPAQAAAAQAAAPPAPPAAQPAADASTAETTAADAKAEPAPALAAATGVNAIPAGPERVSIAAAAGESFTVHAARLPVAVAFELAGRCPGEAALVLDGKPRARGGAQVSAAFGGGRHGYELRCVQPDGGLAPDALAGGHVTALRDGGSAPLPLRAPTTVVDADGKRYTVLFQNLLPRIDLRWPNAPRSTAYSVRVESEGRGTSERQTSKPELSFAAGMLREGSHRLTFSTPQGVRSRTTTLEIRFDNAAPRASVTKPRDGSFTPGSTVEVAGVALPGYQVSLPGGAIELDNQFRFAGSAVTTHARPDVALRIESPRGGVHYYVRRAAAAP